MATTVAKLQAVLGVDDSEYVRGLTKAHATMSTKGKLITGGALAVGAGIAAIGVSSINAAADFEKSMNVLGSVSGATGEQLKALSKEARKLGADTKLPGTSAKDASEAMTELAKAGFTVDQVFESTRSTLLLSAAAEVSNARAAEIASNAVNSFGIKAKRTNIVVDQLANVANASSVSMDQAADSMQMASAVFAGFQKPTLGAEGALRELNIAIGQLGNAGIKGSDAGTSLKQALLQLTAPAARTKRMMEMLFVEMQLNADGMSKLTSAAGLSGKEFDALDNKVMKAGADLRTGGDIAFTASGKMRSLHEIVQLMTGATKNMTDETKAFYVTQIFGADASRAILALMQQGTEGYDKMATAIDKSGSAQAVADAKMKGYRGTMEALKSSVETLQIELGLMLLPAVTKVAEAMVTATAIMQKNTTATKILFVAIGALATALIAAKVAQLLLNLAVLANPYVAAAVSIGIMVAALVILWQKFENARLAIIAFVAKFSPLAALFLLVKNNGDDVAAMFEKLKKTPAMEAITTILKAWISALRTIVDAIKWLIDKIPDIPSLPKPPDFTPWNSEMKKRPVNPTGPPGPQGPVGGGLQGAIAVGQGMGLSVSSLFRPGDPGDHGKGKAVDMAGSGSAMARFANAMFGSGKDIIYGALPFWQDNGRMIQGWLGNMGLRNDHLDHVHYSVFDKGGWLKPGLTLAYNGTGQSERVGGGNLTVNFPNYVGSKAELMGWLQNAAQEFKRRNGRSAF